MPVLVRPSCRSVRSGPPLHRQLVTVAVLITTAASLIHIAAGSGKMLLNRDRLGDDGGAPSTAATTINNNSSAAAVVMGGDKLSFSVLWQDRQSGKQRRFLLAYYLADSSVELFEPERRQWFLRRSSCHTLPQRQHPQQQHSSPAAVSATTKSSSSSSSSGSCELLLDDLWPGNRVRIHGRLMLVADYGDEATRRTVAPSTETTFAMFKPDGVQHMAAILAALDASGLRVTAARMAQLSATAARQFYAEHAERDFFPALLAYIESGPVLGLRLMGGDAVARWRQLIGPTNSERARQTQPLSLRARFGTDGTRNALHGSDSSAAAERELLWFFGAEPLAVAAGAAALHSSIPPTPLSPTLPPPPPSNNNNNQQQQQEEEEERRLVPSTCVVVLPHAVRAGVIPQLLAALTGAAVGDTDNVQQQEELEVTALKLVQLSEQQAEQLLAVYRGVVPEYSALVRQLSDGPLLALRVAAPCTADTAAAVETVRRLVGPRDPAVAALLRPRSLRAQFGVNRVANAVHCSDMAEEAPIELRFFFGD